MSHHAVKCLLHVLWTRQGVKSIENNNEDSVEGSSSSGSSQRTVSGFGAKRGHDRLAKNNDGIVMKTMMSVAASESKTSPDKRPKKQSCVHRHFYAVFEDEHRLPHTN